MYSKIVKEHFTNPKNVGVLKNPTSIGEATTEGGGKVVFYFAVDNGIVKKVKYQVGGCPYAIATCSILSVYAEGKSVTYLKTVNRDTVANFFSFPLDKVKCIDLSIIAFVRGLEGY